MSEPNAPPLDYEAPTNVLPVSVKRAVSSVAGPLIGLAVVLLIFGIWKPERFLNAQNFDRVLTHNYHLAVAAIGATFVIITAGIDLSVGSTMAFACVCCAMAIRGTKVPPASAGTTVALALVIGSLVGLCIAARALQAGQKAREAIVRALIFGGVSGGVVACGWLMLAGRTFSSASPVVAAVVGITAGALVGYLNGSLITSLGLPPFVVTLATLQAIRGLTLDITDGVPISPDYSWTPAALANMESLKQLHFGATSAQGTVWMIPNYWITLGVIVIAIPLLHFTIVGRYTYAIGSNERTARLCGVPVERYKTLCYIIASATAGLAGVMMCAKFNGGQPTEFSGTELSVIAAVVIGGTSLFGGEGTIAGTLLGVLMLGLLYSGCVIADISTYKQQIFIGGTIVLAAALDRFRHLRK